MKFSEGFANLLPTVLIFVFYGISFSLFSFALKTIDISVAYAIWAGVGTAAVVLIGIFYLRQQKTPSSMFLIED